MSGQVYYNYLVFIEDNLKSSLFPVIAPFPVTADHVVANERLTGVMWRVEVSSASILDKLIGSAEVVSAVCGNFQAALNWRENLEWYRRNHSYKSLEELFAEQGNWQGPCKIEYAHPLDDSLIGSYGRYARVETPDGSPLYFVELMNDEDNIVFERTVAIDVKNFDEVD